MPSAELWITFGVEIFVVVVLYQQVDKGKMAMSTAVFLGCASILIGILKGLTTECVVSPRTAIVFGVGGLGLVACVQRLAVPWVWHICDAVPLQLCSLSDQPIPALVAEYNRLARGR